MRARTARALCPPASLDPNVVNDDTDRGATWQSLQAFRKDPPPKGCGLQFVALRTDATLLATRGIAADLWKKGGPIDDIFGASCAKGWASKEGKVVLFLIDAGLFTGLLHQCDPEAYKDTAQPNPELTAALAWMAAQRQSNYRHLALNGRSREVKKELNAWMEMNWNQTQDAELWLTFAPPTNPDFRLPGRKTAWGNLLREVGFVGFEQTRVRIKAKGRGNVGSASGEATTHDMTYSGLATRPWEELPKASRARKQNVLGASVALPTHTSETVQAWLAKGEPLCYNDFKAIQTLVALFEDLDAGHIFDLSPGNAGAAVASAVAGISYEGVCANIGHKEFLEAVIDRALLALMTQEPKEAKASGDHCQCAELEHEIGRLLAHVTKPRDEIGQPQRECT